MNANVLVLTAKTVAAGVIQIIPAVKTAYAVMKKKKKNNT